MSKERLIAEIQSKDIYASLKAKAISALERIAETDEAEFNESSTRIRQAFSWKDTQEGEAFWEVIDEAPYLPLINGKGLSGGPDDCECGGVDLGRGAETKSHTPTLYAFTKEQLSSLLFGAIEMFFEYRDAHEHSEESAKFASVNEMFEGLDGEIHLINEGVNKKASLQTILPDAQIEPVDMLLFCPNCGQRHVDEAKPDVCETCGGEKDDFPRNEGALICTCEAFTAWLNPLHKSHRCNFCNHVFRPADVPTNGVAALKTKGERDGDPRPQQGLVEASQTLLNASDFALTESGCDEEMCSHHWHDRLRDASDNARQALAPFQKGGAV
jgi:rubrerythrin